MVEIDGERVLAPSCCRAPDAGHEGHDRQRARACSRRSWCSSCCSSDMPETRVHAPQRGRRVGRASSASASRASRARAAGRARPVAPGDRGQPRRLHPVHALRARLPRRAGQRRDRPGLPRRRTRRSSSTWTTRWATSTCVACGECVQACPTGALMPARDVALTVPDKQVDSVCPYCGVGCQLTYNVKDNKILYVEGRDGPANHGRLCVKGRYGFDYAHHPQRLTQAADPPRRRAQARPTSTMDPRPRARRLPRGDAGKKRWSSPAAGCAQHPRHARPEGARRLRLGQGQQRRGLPVPEAGAHRLRQQQRRPLHAPVPRVVASSRCSKASARARSRTR